MSPETIEERKQEILKPLAALAVLKPTWKPETEHLVAWSRVLAYWHPDIVAEALSRYAISSEKWVELHEIMALCRLVKSEREGIVVRDVHDMPAAVTDHVRFCLGLM